MNLFDLLQSSAVDQKLEIKFYSTIIQVVLSLKKTNV